MPAGERREVQSSDRTIQMQPPQLRRRGLWGEAEEGPDELSVVGRTTTLSMRAPVHTRLTIQTVASGVLRLDASGGRAGTAVR